MWYYAGDLTTCHARSRDGIHSEKPSLDVAPGTNVVLEHPGRRDSGVVWLDPEGPSEERFKMSWYDDTTCEHVICLSPDGIHWERATETAFTQ